ncbi:MAG: hypothetical protein WAW85_03175 [Gordonia sp. (in: high G+C Gram-positive bacteria)]|uniref:hypothetical protein n=1 Tax=Gordonia sp. (in: high G+C Gram-positive bacteria) TaxID=84139 RepID=UPI003BB723F7
MDETTQQLAGRLLDAQVDFALRQLTNDADFTALVNDELDFYRTDSGTLPLEVVMPRQLIKDVARKYTMAFPVEGAIPELVGQVAARLYRSEIHETTSLSDILGPRRFDELSSIATGLPVTRHAVEHVLDSPATTDTIVEVVQRAVEYRFGAKLARRLARPVEKWTRRGSVMVVESARANSGELLADAVRDFWRGSSDEAIAGFRDAIAEADVEDTVVLIFEFWRTFRQTDYFRSLLDSGIDEVFDTYGATPIADVVEDLGVTEDDLRIEAQRFGPAVIKQLAEQGFLEALLRRRLAVFYTSPEFLDAVTPPDQPAP